MSTIKQVPLTCGGHTRPVVHLDFSDVTRDGYFLISACKDGKPMLRQGETGDWIGTFEGHKGAVWGVALTQNANIAASGAADFTAKLWDARYGEVVHTFEHEHIVKSVNFNCDDTLLLTASNEKLIRVYDINKTEVGAVEKISAHTSSIRHAVFLHNSRIVSVSDDLTMRVWDRTSGQEVHKIEFATIPNSLELSRDGAVLTVAHGTNVSFYSSDTMRKMREFPVPTKCYSASLAPSRATFVCGGEDLKVYKFDYNTGTELARRACGPRFQSPTRVTSVRCTACAGRRTGSCTPRGRRTARCGCGRPCRAACTGCGAAARTCPSSTASRRWRPTDTSATCPVTTSNVQSKRLVNTITS